MKRKPTDIGPVHFVGIGGIGMSGIAEVMKNIGYTVQGSDAAENYTLDRLRKLGIKVTIGQAAENLGDASVVVVSSAIKADNPELKEARARKLPVVRRAEMLAELMRLKSSVAIAGTHGKTTTTTMVATLLDAGKLDPTVINGGIINAYSSNARLGAGEWMVVEADESDGTFNRLPATVAIVTNIDPEHLDHYKTFDGVKAAFQTFIENLPFYGFAVCCIDHPEVQALVGRVHDRRIVTYGFNAQADVRASNLRAEHGQSVYDVTFSDRVFGGAGTIEGITLPMPGPHNALNSLAAITVARELGVSDEACKQALATFGGVKRRFTRTGEWNGVTIIDDYGHHPVEIAAVMKAARQVATGKVIAVVQPHRFSRVRDLFQEFCACLNDADIVLMADIYPAGELPIEGINKTSLVDGLRAHGHKDARVLGSPDDLPKIIREIAQPGDYVVFLGAGSITYWANEMPAKLAAGG